MTNVRRRLVFVDDDTVILQGLQRLLFDADDDWEVAFFSSPLDAQQFMNEFPCDMVITDIRMRAMDGIALLSWARDQHPAAVRIVLSGVSETNTILRAIPFAHAFLTKPCPPSVLTKVLRRSCALQSLLQDEALRRAVGRIDTLPINPAVFSRLTVELADMGASASDVSAIVAADLSLTSKVLHLANNAFFGLPGKFLSIEQAVSFVGVRMLRKLVLSAEVFGAWDAHLADCDQAVGRERRHGVACAAIARAIAGDKEHSNSALSAAMLHDVGKLVLTLRDERGSPRLQGAPGQALGPSSYIETTADGTSHGRAGAYLLGLWGLPYPVVEAVAYHHDPATVASSEFDVPTIVHVADALAHEVENDRGMFENDSMLDMAHLRNIGVLGQLPAWRALSRRVMAGLE